MQDGIWNGNFAYIVQQSAALNVNKIVFVNFQSARQFEGEFSDAPGVTFGVFITQFEGVRPTLQCFLVCLFELFLSLFLLSNISKVDDNALMNLFRTSVRSCG